MLLHPITNNMQKTCQVISLCIQLTPGLMCFFPGRRKQYHMTPMKCPIPSQYFRSPVSPGPPSWSRPLSALGSPMQAAMLRGFPENSYSREETSNNSILQLSPTDKTRSGKAEAQTVCWRNLKCHRSDTSEGSIPPCLVTKCGMQST